MLRDARTMTGPEPLPNREAIRAYWEQFAATRGFVRLGSSTGPGAELISSGVRIPAYVNQSRWVADCPLCNAGIAAMPGMEECACLGCGTIFKVDYPDASEIADAEAALSVRPEEAQNWHPAEMADRGIARESPSNLRQENIQRGLPPTPGAGAGPMNLDEIVPRPPAVEERIRALADPTPEGARQAEETIELLKRQGLIPRTAG